MRFDGLRFQVFNTGNTKGLRSGRFMWLFEDRAGNLWINTEGQGLTRYKDGVFTSFTTENGLPSNQVGKMYEDSAGNLRAQTAAGLMQWVDGSFQATTRAADEPLWYDEGGRLHKVEPGRPTVDLNPGYYVNGFYEDREGRLWIGTREERLVSRRIRYWCDRNSIARLC